MAIKQGILLSLLFSGSLNKELIKVYNRIGALLDLSFYFVGYPNNRGKTSTSVPKSVRPENFGGKSATVNVSELLKNVTYRQNLI